MLKIVAECDDHTVRESYRATLHIALSRSIAIDCTIDHKTHVINKYIKRSATDQSSLISSTGSTTVVFDTVAIDTTLFDQ